MDNQKQIYQIQVSGKIDEDWSDYFSGMDIETQRAGAEHIITSLTGTVTDQSALRGILNKLWDLNVILISVIQLDRRMQK